MPIHDAGYRRYQGPVTGSLLRWLAILRSEIRLAFRSKKMIALYALCIAPTLFFLAMIWARFVLLPLVNPQEPGVGPTAPPGPFGARIFDPTLIGFYLYPVRFLSFALFALYSAVVGTGIIARDKRANAMELYLARSVDKRGYFAGKWSAVMALFCLQSLLPVLVLWFAAVAFYPDWTLLENTWVFMPRVLLALAVMCGFLSFLVTAASACTDSPAFAALVWVVLLSLMQLVGGILLRLSANLSLIMLSPWFMIGRIVEDIAGVSATVDCPASHAWLALTGYVVLGLILARRGLRAVEVVG